MMLRREPRSIKFSLVWNKITEKGDCFLRINVSGSVSYQFYKELLPVLNSFVLLSLILLIRARLFWYKEF